MAVYTSGWSDRVEKCWMRAKTGIISSLLGKMSFRDFPIRQCYEVPSQAAPVGVTILMQSFLIGDLSSSP